MFTVEQIKTAHSKVKSGADFPGYIQEIKELGVTHYETFVTDGRTDYYGEDDYKTTAPARYSPLTIAQKCDIASFKAGLKEHQQGKTDYTNFIEMSAKFGVEMWVVHMEKMTCAYYDLAGNDVLTEIIPSPSTNK